MNTVTQFLHEDGQSAVTVRSTVVNEDEARAPRRKVPPAPADAPLMTRDEVAALLRTTARQISNMVARGQLPAPVRVAGLGLRWRRPEIGAWIAAQ